MQHSIEAYELWRSLYPRDSAPVNNLAVVDLFLGKTDKALPLANEAVRLSPDSRQPIATLAKIYLKSGNYDAVASLCNDPEHERLGTVAFHVACFQLALLRHDDTAMRRQLQWSSGTAQESTLLSVEAVDAASHGKMQLSHRLFDESLHHAANVRESVNAKLASAGIEAELGSRAAGRQAALALLGESQRDPDVQMSLAEILATVGETARARMVAEQAASEAPRDVILNELNLPTVRSAIHRTEHDFTAAVQALEPTRPYELCASMPLEPVYERGLALLEENRPQAAAAEFRRCS